MNTWTPSEGRPGYTSKTIQHGACTIVIHRPILTEPEREKRERRVRETLEHEMTKYITRKMKEGGTTK